MDHQGELVLCTELYEYLEMVKGQCNWREPGCPLCKRNLSPKITRRCMAHVLLHSFVFLFFVTSQVSASYYTVLGRTVLPWV